MSRASPRPAHHRPGGARRAQEAAGQLRFEIEAAFSQGLPNTPMANATVRVVSGNFLTARPVGIVDGIDFMHSGAGAQGRSAAIRRAIDIGALVLLCPFGFSPTGEAFNLTMEDVATATAIALQADKLLFLTEVPGIRERQDDAESAIDTELALADAERLLLALPAPTQPTDTAFYLQHCVKACEGGVERSHILPFAVDGALLLEVFTHDGIGTMVVDEKLESLREATADDVGGILQLIEPFERDGTLVRRERTEIERDIGNYTVIEHDGVIFGCAALYPYPEARTAEMAALTVSPLVAGPGRRRADAQAHRAPRARRRAGQHLRAHHAHDALVSQARLHAGRPRLAARGAQTKIQLGPALAGAGQETGLTSGDDDGPHREMRLFEEGKPKAWISRPIRANSASGFTTTSARRPSSCGRSTRPCWSTRTASISPMPVLASISRARWSSSSLAVKPTSRRGMSHRPSERP